MTTRESSAGKQDPRTYAIIGAAMEVHRQLGPGFLEAVYLEALVLELERQGIPVQWEVRLPLRYKGALLRTQYRADLVCFGTVLVELKALARLAGTEDAQILNYLKATGCEVGLLLNFGAPSLQHKRFVYNPFWGSPEQSQLRQRVSSGSDNLSKSTKSVAGLLGRELKTATRAAETAGEVLREMRGQVLNAREKSDRTLVTDADAAAEAEILNLLRDEFPEDAILSEEEGDVGPESDRLWIVDPLDGTTNYSHELPFFATSIALWIAGEPVVGVVYLPVLDELFAAVRGGGATLNGQEIAVSDVASVEQAMLNCYFDRRNLLDDGLALFDRVARRSEGRVKVMGSTASLLCYVACGRLDGSIRNTTKIFDFAAGALVLEEAGGALTDFEGQPLRTTGQSLLATNARIHAELRDIVRENRA